jgi:hypothetical protein
MIERVTQIGEPAAPDSIASVPEEIRDAHAEGIFRSPDGDLKQGVALVLGVPTRKVDPRIVESLDHEPPVTRLIHAKEYLADARRRRE